MPEQTPDHMTGGHVTNGYVTNSAWVRTTGRVDAIDEVADQFERPAAPGAEAFWTPDTGTVWPRSSRGWRSMARIHPPAHEHEHRAAS